MPQVRFTLLLMLISMPLLYCMRHRNLLRVLHGTKDKSGKHSYVVALVSHYIRECTGTFINPEWVLTAAHCLDEKTCNATHVQYGDMTLLPNITKKKTKILQRIPHPGFRLNELLNDVGLVRVDPLSLKRYGKLSAVDYRSLMGLAVEYAGFGETENVNDDDRQPLILGEGVVTSCLDYFSDDDSPGPFICVAPKCENRNGDAARGDSGGPLFLDNKIVGIICTGLTPIGFYAAISPDITWIAESIAIKARKAWIAESVDNNSSIDFIELSLNL